MTRQAVTPADLLGRTEMLNVVCSKCDRRGRYRVQSIVREIGLDGLSVLIGTQLRIRGFPSMWYGQRQLGGVPIMPLEQAGLGALSNAQRRKRERRASGPRVVGRLGSRQAR